MCMSKSFVGPVKMSKSSETLLSIKVYEDLLFCQVKVIFSGNVISNETIDLWVISKDKNREHFNSKVKMLRLILKENGRY